MVFDMKLLTFDNETDVNHRKLLCSAELYIQYRLNKVDFVGLPCKLYSVGLPGSIFEDIH